jgi:hypothetical protein
MREISKRAIAFTPVGVALLLFAGYWNTPHDSSSLTSIVQANESEGDCSDMGIPEVSTSEAKVLGGDIVPVRSVQDPYPSLHSVAIDSENNRVLMSDSNRGSLLFYERTSEGDATSIAISRWQIRGPATGMMFVAGVTLDPAAREVFAVNNDIGDRMEVFPYDQNGNVKPKRVLSVPHGSWGVSLNRQRDEIAISVEHVNTVVVYRRTAAGAEAPLRSIRGPKTGLSDPHGIAFDSTNSEIIVANHGNWAPLTRAESSEGELKGGHFQAPSITVYPAEATGDVGPARTIHGDHTGLNWPMGIAVDAVHDEIAVASYGSDSINVFRRTDNGNATPIRVIRGSQTGISGPMGIAIDLQNDEYWVTNYRDHSAVVFSRTAQGNVSPKRTLRNAPVGTPTVGFGNPGAVAYDSKRGEILVPN